MKEKLLKIEGFIAELPTKAKDLSIQFLDNMRDSLLKMKDLVDTNYKLGLFHMDKGNIYDAKMRFLFVTKLKPDFLLAHYHLARCHIFNLDFSKAREELGKVLSLDPHFDKATYRLELINHDKKDLLIPSSIVKEDYNSLAHKYEKNMLEQEKYTAPEVLANAISSYLEKIPSTDEEPDLEEPENEYTCLDVGCGTGLAGIYLAQDVTLKSLIGIDLAPNMIELSKTLEINNKLLYSKNKNIDFNDIKSIASLGKKFDIILACMSLGYADNLSSILEALHNISLKDGILGITVLKSSSKDVEFNYEHACLSFSKKFLNKISAKTNWTVIQCEEMPLFDNRSTGFTLILKKET
jgi:predicted TPR repeat methyltransferase